MLIKVVKIGSKVEEVMVSSGASVKEALEIAGITSVDGFEIRLNGKMVSVEDTITEEGILTLYSDKEALAVPCAAKALIYNTLILGGSMASRIKEKVKEKKCS